MKLSLPLLMVICLIGYSYCLSSNEEKKTKVICEEYEFSNSKLSENELNKVKLVKLKSCLTTKKKQIDREENEKRKKRSTDELDNNTSFADLFKTSAAFKRVLKSYMKLKQNVMQKTNQLQNDISNALVDFTNDYDDVEDERANSNVNKPTKLTAENPKDNTLRCEKDKYVIKVKQAILTNKDHEKMCSSLTQDFKLNLENMDQECYNKDEATKRLSVVCDGHSECEVSIALLFNTLCDCTEMKQLEVEYTCEPETEAHKISKRALYYQNDKFSQKTNNRFNKRILDYYDRFQGDYYDDYYYYDDCAYDYFSYSYGGGCDYYDYYYDNYYYDYYGGMNRNDRYNSRQNYNNKPSYNSRSSYNSKPSYNSQSADSYSRPSGAYSSYAAYNSRPSYNNNNYPSRPSYNNNNNNYPSRQSYNNNYPSRPSYRKLAQKKTVNEETAPITLKEKAVDGKKGNTEGIKKLAMNYQTNNLAYGDKKREIPKQRQQYRPVRPDKSKGKKYQRNQN